MLLVLAATAAVAAVQPAPQRSATAVAQATIRIVEPVRLRMGADRSLEGQPVRDAMVRSEDGRQQRAKLVELE